MKGYVLKRWSKAIRVVLVHVKKTIIRNMAVLDEQDQEEAYGYVRPDTSNEHDFSV